MINVRGMTLSLHPFFVILMLFSVVTGHFLELITLFVIVFIHELGHAGAALMYGVRIRSIQFLPFGGVVEIEDQGRLTAWKEIVIAAAGPLQNGMMILFALLLRLAGWGDGAFLSYVIYGNAMIALFNLLPILPLDGGKILQSAASLFFPYHRTLLWSSRISVGASVIVIICALAPLFQGKGSVQLNLLLIGIFLLYSNWVDYRNLPYRFTRFLMHRESMYTRSRADGELAQPIVADPAKHLDSILRLLKREKYHLIYVMNERGKIIAVLPEQRIISAYFATDRTSWI
ncbi:MULTISPECIES: M50 family metallopeptidase [Paenibacillus]|uniref:Stage IV sporulation protein FB n=1 Tax=Paenibacillus favisporus TaxID=221028 RepID=A0ABV2FAD8_9BACL|nr:MULTISPECIES: M50 family metallopeptidase [Paenibacillus]MCM3001990.1 M50 family metallopeptidase [Paenibacillus cellulositrophicus]OXL85179.1 Zn-dependent protease [Paenibacillus sp. SSG-1]GIO64418.1 stage IV sporulation protein FB [Paenibacillus cineris]